MAENNIGLKYIGQVPKEEIRRFETELYSDMRAMIEENDEWARSSLEKSITIVLR